MNIYKELNGIIEYIEENLENEIKYEELARRLGVNEYTMQRLFSLLCNISIAEYIRNRRLSNAGFDLQNSNNKIVDIAVKYQYESATAFSRAFEKFHGIKPSIVKDNPEKLKIFTKIVFTEVEPVQNSIEYSIITRDELVLYGKGVGTTEAQIGKDAPAFFQKFRKEYCSKFGEPNYGMTIYEKRFESDKLKYCVLYDRDFEGLDRYVIPKSKWIVLKIPSQKAKDIQEITCRFYVDFLPSSKYKLKNIPELEYYYDDVTELLVALED